MRYISMLMVGGTMPIKDQELIALVDEQRKYYQENAPIEKKIDVQKRIEKRQKKLTRYRND